MRKGREKPTTELLQGYYETTTGLLRNLLPVVVRASSHHEAISHTHDEEKL